MIPLTILHPHAVVALLVCGILLAAIFIFRAPVKAKPVAAPPVPPTPQVLPAECCLLQPTGEHGVYTMHQVPVEALEVLHEALGLYINRRIGPRENGTSAAYRRLAHDLQRRIGETLKAQRNGQASQA